MTVRPPSRRSVAIFSVIPALAAVGSACTTPGASGIPSVAPSDAMMEDSAAPSDAMMDSAAPSDAVMEHSAAPSDAMKGPSAAASDAMMEQNPAPS